MHYLEEKSKGYQRNRNLSRCGRLHGILSIQVTAAPVIIQIDYLRQSHNGTRTPPITSSYPQLRRVWPMSRMRIVLLVLLVTNGARGWTSSRFRPCRSLSRDAVGSQLRRSRKEERSGAKYWHSNTVLPSSYSEARCPPLCVWLMPSPRRFFKTMKERRGIVRTVKLIVSIVLSLVVIFGPMCSTAQAMVTGSLDATASSLAIKSRALGSFNLYPSRKDLELSFRLIYAACCGALIGLERSAAERPAGVRWVK